jgi:hypothetical protein
LSSAQNIAKILPHAYKSRNIISNIEAKHQALVFSNLLDAAVVSIAPPDDNGDRRLLMKLESCSQSQKSNNKKTHMVAINYFL